MKELFQHVILTYKQQFFIRKYLGFNFQIEYKMRAANIVVDALSRVEDKSLKIVTHGSLFNA